MLRSFSRIMRNFSSAAYDCPGKTTVTILNQEMKDLMIDSYDTSGFRLNNKIKAFGPIIIFPQAIFSWTIPNSSLIDEKSLTLINIVTPKPEIVVIGYGSPDNEFNLKTILTLKKTLKLNVECLPTERAVSTFNFLVAEERLVAGAFIPPDYIRNFDEVDRHYSEFHKRGENIFNNGEPSVEELFNKKWKKFQEQTYKRKD